MCPDHARDPQPALRHHIMLVEVPAVEIRIGDDGLARHLVEGDVLRRQLRGSGHHQCIGHPRRVGDRPLHGLHRAQRASHHCGEPGDPEMVGQPRLGIDPVFHRDHRKIGAIATAGLGIEVPRAGAAEAATQVVDPDDEKPCGIEWLAGPDHVVPPARLTRCIGVGAGDMVRSVQCVAHQYRIGAGRVEPAIGFVDQFEMRYRPAAPEGEGLGKARDLRTDDANRMGIQVTLPKK